MMIQHRKCVLSKDKWINHHRNGKNSGPEWMCRMCYNYGNLTTHNVILFVVVGGMSLLIIYWLSTKANHIYFPVPKSIVHYHEPSGIRCTRWTGWWIINRSNLNHESLVLCILVAQIRGHTKLDGGQTFSAAHTNFSLHNFQCSVHQLYGERWRNDKAVVVLLIKHIVRVSTCKIITFLCLWRLSFECRSLFPFLYNLLLSVLYKFMWMK